MKPSIRASMSARHPPRPRILRRHGGLAQRVGGHDARASPPDRGCTAGSATGRRCSTPASPASRRASASPPTRRNSGGRSRLRCATSPLSDGPHAGNARARREGPRSPGHGRSSAFAARPPRPPGDPPIDVGPALKSIADTAKPLYASLDEQQKRMFAFLSHEMMKIGRGRHGGEMGPRMVTKTMGPPHQHDAEDREPDDEE